MRVRLIKALERTVAHGHPWVYLDALGFDQGPAQGSKGPDPGTVLTLLDRRGRFLARGLAEAGPIGMRVFTTRDEPLDGALIEARVTEALALRARMVPPQTDAYRLCHGEGDRLPGVVCDRYGDTAVLKFDGQAISRWREPVCEAFSPALRDLGIQNLVVRSGRGTKKRLDLVFGTLPEGERIVHECGMKLSVDLARGQKTGLFLDHRESRRRVRELSQGQRVLNLYSYTGGFSIAAGLGGAESVTTVDVAPGAIDLARTSWAANDLPQAGHEAHAADVEDFMNGAIKRGQRWNLIIADPPSFAPNQASRAKALKAYTAVHRSVLKVLEPGGLYLAASCSSHVDRRAFEGSIEDAAHSVRRSLQIIDRWAGGADHPLRLGFPEGDYLTVSLLRALV